MKHIKKFETYTGIELTKSANGSLMPGILNNHKKSHIFYSNEWEKYLPKKIEIIKDDKKYLFQKGNVMLVADLVEVTYDSISENRWGVPDTLEFDFYFLKNSNANKMKIDIDITFGDLMACEFSVESPDIVKVIQHTTYKSKFDPSDTVFALSDKSLQDFVDFLNKINGFKLNRSMFNFLDQYDNYRED